MAFIAMLAAGGFLAWLVISHSLVAYLAHAAPNQALWLDSTEPTVLVNRADQAINLDALAVSAEAIDPAAGNPSPGRFAFNPTGSSTGAASAVSGTATPTGPVLSPEKNNELRALLEQGLQREPLDPRALRLLGQLADDAGDTSRAAKFMLAAERHSLREILAVYWLASYSSNSSDHTGALFHSDVLLRTRSQFMPYAMPALVKAAESKSATAAVTSLLASNPPWRPQFFNLLPASITDARTPLGLLLALKDTAAPPVPAEIRGYLDFLLARKFYDLSYYTWLQLLPAEQLANTGFLFNGSFEAEPTASPFDWAFHPGPGVTIDRAAREDQPGHQALLVEFSNGRVEFGGVDQVTMLGPGTYQMTGVVKGQLLGRRGLVWRMSCLETITKPIGQSAMQLGLIRAWKDFEFSFTVPPGKCRAQYLRLELDARSASEQIVSGAMWFDDLRIGRSEIAGK